MPEGQWNSRKLFRIFLKADVAFRLNKASKSQVQLKEETVVAKLLDLSAGGCGLESSHFIPPGSKLNVFIDLNLLTDKPTKHKRFSRIVGVVRASRPSPNHKYRLGVQFEKIHPAHFAVIKTFVDNNERRKDPRVSI